MSFNCQSAVPPAGAAKPVQAVVKACFQHPPKARVADAGKAASMRHAAEGKKSGPLAFPDLDIEAMEAEARSDLTDDRYVESPVQQIRDFAGDLRLFFLITRQPNADYKILNVGGQGVANLQYLQELFEELLLHAQQEPHSESIYQSMDEARRLGYFTEVGRHAKDNFLKMIKSELTRVQYALAPKI